MNVVHIGSGSEFVEIRLPSSYSSEGWAQAEVEVAVHCFQGTIRPWVEAVDFELFTAQLRVLYESLQGDAEFSPLEKQIVLKLTGTTGGHIQVTGEAWSQATYENKLTFIIELDQSYLLAPLQELERILSLGAKRDA
ncbi:hypothetical protein [Methylobacter sp.]|uniref:WapI family immunity protein n=1 Tax=Methylobacter sp. TaxID=2051955 RepID=UPI0012264DD3|nr:hypothetical protein [Methylobacter sp.]TAK62563.1 MAG: hypothetical protein EPO18_09960 [Methylobacter sp.]